MCWFGYSCGCRASSAWRCRVHVQPWLGATTLGPSPDGDQLNRADARCGLDDTGCVRVRSRGRPAAGCGAPTGCTAFPQARSAAVNNAQRSARLRQQLERRCEVLAEWVKLGISRLPEGTSVPVSLNQVRQWDAVSLGIEKIGSAASFTTTHPVYGSLVRDVDRLLRELGEQRAAQRKRKRSRGADCARRLALMKRSLSEAANRYAVLSAELKDTGERLRVADKSAEQFKRENAELRSEVRTFKVELARRSTSGTVTAIDMVRPGAP